MSNTGSTMIETAGSTSLSEIGDNYFLQPDGGQAVELSYNGSPVFDGEFDQNGGHWVPIAAEQTATGYEVAWKIAGADTYTVWYMDANGNDLSSPFATASGSSATLELFETSFQQDLNGDGVIGVPASQTVIETAGSTSLSEIGDNYFLQPDGGQAVELSYNGSPVFDGEFDQNGGHWVPIAAEQTATGYEVAWKIAGADTYTVWYMDANGNDLSSPFATASGSSATLELFETSFQQDLNGDGVIGVPASQTVIETAGSTSLSEIGDNYFLQPDGGQAVELSYNGSPVFDGEFDQNGGHWVPIAAEQTATGYEVAWKIAGADTYTVWYMDANGNDLSSPFATASGSSATLELFETSFQQDLNGDGVIGVPASQTVIETAGSTSLSEIGDNYFLQPDGGQAVELSYNGSPVFDGEFDQNGGHWVPIAAEQTATGYEVAWKIAGADTYTVWYMDANGNDLSSPFATASGSSATLESFETSFQQDLNGDGVIGVPASQTVIETAGSTSLSEIGDNYFLQPDGGQAVELSYNGSPVFDGEFDQNGGHWVPIAAEQTATGYEVAWKIAGADTYTVWYMDANGNDLSSPFATASGSSATLESFETSFQQDLNGDGVIGVPASQTVIETAGSTSLSEIGDNYFLQPDGGQAVELSYNGSPVFDGEFDQNGGHWVPIAAEQTATGYEVAWKIAGADTYTVWYTDANGNDLSSPFATASGSSATLELFETSFQQDLNGDGVIGETAGPGDVPQFVYAGTDSAGAQIYDITWSTPGSQPIAVRVLTPTDPSSADPHSFLFALPVEAGLTQPTWGSGLDELAKLDVQDEYNTTIIEPIFPVTSWYADNSIDPTINYETFMSSILPQWVDSQFSTTGDEKNLLIGFSKSGYGDLDLLLKHPDVFDAAAAFDFPGDMTSYDDYGANTNYGTQANFQDNYQLTDSFIDNYKTPFTTQDRILISEGQAFPDQVADFNALLASHGVADTLLNQTSDTHSWSSGWLPDAVAGLFGLEQNLHKVA